MQKLKRLSRPDSQGNPIEQNLSDLAKSEKTKDKDNSILSRKLLATKTIAKKRSFLKKPLGASFFILSMLGILFTAGGYFAWISFLSNPPLHGDKKLLYNPVTQEPVSLTLNISSPDDNILVFSEDLLVSGKASPNSTVFLSLNDSDQVLDVNPQGNFSQTIKLQKGVNQIYIGAADSEGNTKGENKTIYYSTEKI